METKHFLQSKAFQGIMWGLGISFAALFIFVSGMTVGTHRAFFACKWGENYGRTFGGSMGVMQVRVPPPMFQKQVVSFHGALGDIISITDDGIVVKGRDDVERSVLITEGTEIHSGDEKLGKEDLQSGMQVMTFGEPSDEGRLEAKFIRVLNKDFLP